MINHYWLQLIPTVASYFLLLFIINRYKPLLMITTLYNNHYLPLLSPINSGYNRYKNHYTPL